MKIPENVKSAFHSALKSRRVALGTASKSGIPNAVPIGLGKFLELNLENVMLENIHMEADNGLTCMDANGVYVRNIRLVVKNKPAIQIYNSMNVDIAGLDVPNMEDTGIEIRGEKTENIRIQSVTPSVAGTATVIGEEVKATSIEIL